MVTPYYLAPLKFLTLSFFHAEPPTIHNYSSGFPTSALVPEEVSAHGSPLSQLRFFLSTSLTDLRRNVEFFSLFRFLFVRVY